MIKPEELRIGDFVRVSNDNCMIPKGAICEVVAIDSERSCEDKKGIVGLLQTDREKWMFSHGVWCDGIEGITITPEILEKNGWQTKMFGGSKFFCIELNCYLELCVTYVKKDNKFDVGTFSSIPGGHLDINFFPIDLQYVHQLQHILWALGEDAKLII